MLDVSSLYDPIRNRYKGVYQSKTGAWEASVTTPLGVFTYLATFSSQEECAQRVAAYYTEQYGPGWPEMLKDRQRRLWRIRKIKRSSSITVYIAEVRLSKSTDWCSILARDIGSSYNWSSVGNGWLSAAVALVAIRIYRFNQSCTDLSPCQVQHQPSSVVPKVRHSSR